jgi:uncharacterized protein YecE (DUF72 family)
LSEQKTSRIRIGTSSFTAAGWESSFYPPGLRKSDYLAYYASQFDSLEIDSTFYRIPALSTVARWYAETPTDFVFACKFPQSITHEKCLEDCGGEQQAFLTAMGVLKEKAGPLLLQFPYFNRKAFAKPEEFWKKLRPFLAGLSKEFRYAVEIRNKGWLTADFSQMLREYGIAMAVLDHPWMPRPREALANGKCDPLTTDFSYARLLGDRYAIEEQTKTWDKVIVDRSRELQEWEKAGETIVRRGIELFVYVNNHFAGHAPETVRQLREIWKAWTSVSQGGEIEESGRRAAKAGRIK